MTFLTSLAGLIMILIALLLALGIFTKLGKRADRILLPALLIWVCGVALYFIGFKEGEDNRNILQLVLRSALSSVEMFVSNNDLLEIEHINKKLTGNIIYMSAFAIVHFLAVVITMLAALNLLGGKVKQFIKKFKSGVRLYFKAPKDLYIFVGVNEASIITAGRIQNNPKKKENGQIVFVEFPESEGKEHIGFTSLLGLTSLKPGLLDKIEKIGHDVLLYYASKSFTELISFDPRKQGQQREQEQELQDPKKRKKHYFNVFRELGLGGFFGLVPYIKRSQNVKIFFLSDDQQDNILSFEALCSDPYILENSENKHAVVPNGPRFTIYCHARRDNLNIVCENRFMDVEKIEVHIVDTSYLSVYYLKTNFRYNPVSFVDIKDGCVTSAFNSMIIGFGETGQDVFGFLHEFSAFEGPDGKKSPTHCTIIDHNMEQIKYSYLASHPAIASHSDIEMLQMTHKSKEFWDTLRRQIQNLNYIIISLGDDEESLSLAISIYYFACRERKNHLDGFKIFVRVYHFDDEKRMNILGSYYNSKNVFQPAKTYPNFVDDNVEDEEGDDGTIVIFGELDEIFKLDYIFNEDEADKTGYVNSAHEFYRSYQAVRNEEGTWESRRQKLIESSKGNDRLLFNFLKLKRQETQDLADSLHMDTKLHLLGLIPKESLNANPEMADVLMREYKQYLENMIDCYQGSLRQEKARRLLSVAKTEHRRWVASMELLGYSPRTDGQPDCDDISRQHGCMCEWNELDRYENADMLRTFDKQVVETTLRLKMNNLDKFIKQNFPQVQSDRKES